MRTPWNACEIPGYTKPKMSAPSEHGARPTQFGVRILDNERRFRDVAAVQQTSHYLGNSADLPNISIYKQLYELTRFALVASMHYFGSPFGDCDLLRSGGPAAALVAADPPNTICISS